MTVGNDVVDLFDPEARPESLHPRFDERVFTAVEREAIASSGDAHLTRWLMWAAKESAYKVARRLSRSTPFSPVRFRVEMEGADRGAVRYDEMRFPFRIQLAREYLHAVATHPSSPVESGGLVGDARRVATDAAGLKTEVRRLRDTPAEPAVQAREANRLSREVVSRLYGLAGERLEVVRHQRIPRLLYDGEPLPADLSISHHGRFAAVAIRYLPVEASP